MYKITLYDLNCSPLADGPISFFTEDIDDFQNRWFALEDSVDRKNKFLQSKEGKIVTEWYSDEEEYNIVQEDEVTIYGEKEVVLSKKEFEVESAYYSFYAEHIAILFRWIKFKNRYYRIANYRADGICEVDYRGLNHTVECKGNHIVENVTPLVTEYRWIFADLHEQGKLDEVEDFNDASKYLDPNFTTLKDSQIEAFADNSVETICFVTNYYFENQDHLENDMSEFEINDEILGSVFVDLVGAEY